jgi:putative transposase
VTGHPLTRVCEALGISPSTAYRASSGRPSFYRRQEDPKVLAQIRSVTRKRASYGHRRVTVLVNRTCGTRCNRKRIRRVMRIHGLQLPPNRRRRNGRPHTGRVATERSDVRWCSDILEIPCWNGETVQVGFVLDCHDRDAIAWVGRDRDLRGEEIRKLMTEAAGARFPAGKTPRPIQFLSDNGAPYTALETVIRAEELGLVPITTPAASPESNGMSEAFVNTIRRDYADMADRSSAAAVLAQLPSWCDDYNHVAPHSALGMKTPAEYRRERNLS